VIEVAHSLSAKKRVRQNLKRRARNRARKAQVREEGKLVLAAIAKGDASAAEQQFRKFAQRVDRVAAKGTIHKNTAARKRSRMAKRLNKLRAAGAGTTAAKA
jgi:small subunit ribosomal protein S20